jgi:NADH-quinone oxidoreductase subunit L
VLHATAHWPKSPVPYYLMLLGVVLTALYMTRQVIYVFFGKSRASSPAHESPRVMTGPLLVLAVCTVGLSFILTPAWPWLHSYLSGEAAEIDFGHLIQPMLFVSLAVVAAGIGLGILMYRNAGIVDPLESAQPSLFRFLEHKMWIDELYAHTVIAVSRGLALLSSWLDRYLWDGIVRTVGVFGNFVGGLTSGADERGINAGVDKTAIRARGLGGVLARVHSGQVQLYLGAIAVAVVALLLFYAWLA